MHIRIQHVSKYVTMTFESTMLNTNRTLPNSSFFFHSFEYLKRFQEVVEYAYFSIKQISTKILYTQCFKGQEMSFPIPCFFFPMKMKFFFLIKSLPLEVIAYDKNCCVFFLVILPFLQQPSGYSFRHLFHEIV